MIIIVCVRLLKQGTDHAGIATQLQVEKALIAEGRCLNHLFYHSLSYAIFERLTYSMWKRHQ